MAMQSGVGLSKILVGDHTLLIRPLASHFLSALSSLSTTLYDLTVSVTGYTGTILFKNGKLSDIFGELQALVKGLEKSGKDSEGETDHAEAIAAQ
ncbi:hypothetical protein CRG98_023608, partial [Punica granatum]